MVKRTKKVNIAVVQTPIKQQIITGLMEQVDRVLDNSGTAEDTIAVGAAIQEFKKSDMYQVLKKISGFIVDSLLDETGIVKSDVSAERALGIQIGARKVISTLSGLERAAQILDKQIDARRAMNKESEEENLSPEDLTPNKSTGGNVAI